MGEPHGDASACERVLRDDLLEILGRAGVHQLPRLVDHSFTTRAVKDNSLDGFFLLPPQPHNLQEVAAFSMVFAARRIEAVFGGFTGHWQPFLSPVFSIFPNRHLSSAGKAVIDEAAFQGIPADIHDGMVDDTLADGRCVYDSLLRFEYIEGVVMPEGIVPGDEDATDFLEIIGEFRAIGGNIRAECLATLNLPEGDLQILQVTDVLVDVPQALHVVCISSTDASSFAAPR